MALLSRPYAPERLSRILLKYAAATEARPEWKGHSQDDEAQGRRKPVIRR
ncbi:MAG TPA: hypothetical protein VFZ16_15010 [Hyphomicrobiaceae bacterium]|nr:hypothetical protein [Hyphomicrobiaceae bacterium]